MIFFFLSSKLDHDETQMLISTPTSHAFEVDREHFGLSAPGRGNVRLTGEAELIGENVDVCFQSSDDFIWLTRV